MTTTLGLTRRGFALATPGLLAACSSSGNAAVYDEAVTRVWRHGPLEGLEGEALSAELVRYATLAPSSHNTQCWKFAVEKNAITVLPDFSRRCPVVDPDDHHLFVSLGCAAENLIHAARAHGLRGEAAFDAAGSAVRVALTPAPAEATALFQAIPARQSTRGDYDGQPLGVETLNRLEAVATSPQVRVLLVTEKPAKERVLEFVIEGNTAQVNDPAFVTELKRWIRFNGADAARRGDGLFAKSAGNPELPTWLGPTLLRFVFTARAENDKYARQMRSSAGVAVFVGAKEDPAHWVEVGRAYERFALLATTLGVRNAHLNMPIELAALRPRFAQAIGLAGLRPDLVLRFGRGPTLPPSLRRPVQAVIV